MAATVGQDILARDSPEFIRTNYMCRCRLRVFSFDPEGQIIQNSMSGPSVVNSKCETIRFGGSGRSGRSRLYRVLFYIYIRFCTFWCNVEGPEVTKHYFKVALRI